MSEPVHTGGRVSPPEALAFLSRTATEFVQMDESVDIHDRICTRLREIAGDVPVIVSSYEKEHGTFTVRGGFKWLEVHATLIVDDNDATVGTTGTLRDITEQKLAAENLQKLYSQTEQDARTKAELLTEVNHRVKNNLMAVQGLLLAERRQADSEGRPFVERAIDSISGRIDGLLTVHELFSASQWGRLRTDFRPCRRRMISIPTSS